MLDTNLCTTDMKPCPIIMGQGFISAVRRLASNNFIKYIGIHFERITLVFPPPVSL